MNIQAGIFFRIIKHTGRKSLFPDFFVRFLTEPRWALQPQGTQWFPQIGLFVVQAISLGPYSTLIWNGKFEEITVLMEKHLILTQT